ncbi:hypothetical protein RCS94_00380 [Orbaceae bacterium ac157xtp]
MLIAPNSYGALSATSANTIQGSRPGFTGQSGAKKLGFKIGNTTYSENVGNLSTATGDINNFNAGLRLDEFEVMNLTASDFSPMADYADVDGDEPHLTAAFSMSPSTFEWRDRTGALISSGDYNKTLGCGSTLKTPLTLRITLPNVKVKSRYGNPSESLSTELVQEYKIGTGSGICFAKPNQMIVYPNNSWYNASAGSWQTGSTAPHQDNGGGYDSTQFDPVNGFKASLSTKFPTTGFPKASFTLIMTSNVSDYTFSSNDSAVTVGTNGKVTLNSKPSGAVTIKAIFKNDTNQVHSYTFNPTTVWVRPTGTTSTGNYAWAKTQCGGSESNIPSRAQLTNSPHKNAPGSWSYFANYYTRAVGGGVFGEWGWTSSANYPGSQWASGDDRWYWTRDPHSTSYPGYRFVVYSYIGGVDWTHISNSTYVACLE